MGKNTIYQLVLWFLLSIVIPEDGIDDRCMLIFVLGWLKTGSGKKSCQWPKQNDPIEHVLGCSRTNLRSQIIHQHIWMFPKIVVPQNGCFIRKNPIKMDDLGYRYFWKHPYKHFGLTKYLKVIASGSGFMNSHHSPCLLQFFSSIWMHHSQAATYPQLSTFCHLRWRLIYLLLHLLKMSLLNSCMPWFRDVVPPGEIKSWKIPQAEHGTYLHRIERDRTACPEHKHQITNISQLCHGMTFRISNAHCLELLEKKRMKTMKYVLKA